MERWREDGGTEGGMGRQRKGWMDGEVERGMERWRDRVR